MEEDAKRRIEAQRARHPDDILLMGDFGVATDRLSDLKLAAGDTLGSLAEQREGLAVIEPLYFKDTEEPARSRSIMVAYAKLAKALEGQGVRDSAGLYYRRSQDLAVRAVARYPENTDARRDLGIVYAWRALFLADGGEIDSAIALYGHASKIAADLAAADPSDVLQQADVAHGHFELGSIYLKGGRYREAEAHSGDAFRRYAGLAAKDTSNAENRVFMARCGRQAGEACEALSTRSGAAAERAQWRSKATEWFEKSLALYRTLGAAGALTGPDAAAPAELARRVEALRKVS